MKKRWFIIIICIIFSLTIGFNMLKKDTITLIINNNTTKDIESLTLSYTGLKDDIKIPTVKANDNIKFKVNINKSFKEGSMKIYYTDKNNEKVEFFIIGYFEKGYNKTTYVDISIVNDLIQITTED